MCAYRSFQGCGKVIEQRARCHFDNSSLDRLTPPHTACADVCVKESPHLMDISGCVFCLGIRVRMAYSLNRESLCRDPNYLHFLLFVAEFAFSTLLFRAFYLFSKRTQTS